MADSLVSILNLNTLSSDFPVDQTAKHAAVSFTCPSFRYLRVFCSNLTRLTIMHFLYHTVAAVAIGARFVYAQDWTCDGDQGKKGCMLIQ